MDLVPKKFKLGSLKYKVKKDKTATRIEDYLGRFDYSDQKVYVASTVSNKKVSKKMEELSFYHELVHCILATMGETDLNKNEQFVDLFATFLHQFEQSKKF